MVGSHSPFLCVLPYNLSIVLTALTDPANLVSSCHHDLAGTILSASVGRAGYSLRDARLKSKLKEIFCIILDVRGAPGWHSD